MYTFKILNIYKFAYLLYINLRPAYHNKTYSYNVCKGASV